MWTSKRTNYGYFYLHYGSKIILILHHWNIGKLSWYCSRKPGEQPAKVIEKTNRNSINAMLGKWSYCKKSLLMKKTILIIVLPGSYFLFSSARGRTSKGRIKNNFEITATIDLSSISKILNFLLFNIFPDFFLSADHSYPFWKLNLLWRQTGRRDCKRNVATLMVKQRCKRINRHQ